MFYKIKNVVPLENYILKVYFQNEIIKYYDVSRLFDRWKIFQNLRSIKGFFSKVKVDNGGYGVSWSDEIDISCNELWDNGILNYDEYKKIKSEAINVAEDSTEYRKSE